MVFQYRAIWQVPGGGTGYSTFHANLTGGTADAQTWADRTRAFFQAINSLIPSNVSISFDSEVTEHSTATGQLTGVIPVTAPAGVTGLGTGQYAAGAGGRVDWNTEGIRNGRRVVGRTFIVPLIGTQFEANGTLVANAITVLSNAAADYQGTGVASVQPAVWSRPVNGAGGALHDIVSASVPDKSALVRSRRD